MRRRRWRMWWNEWPILEQFGIVSHEIECVTAIEWRHWTYRRRFRQWRLFHLTRIGITCVWILCINFDGHRGVCVRFGRFVADTNRLRQIVCGIWMLELERNCEREMCVETNGFGLDIRNERRTIETNQTRWTEDTWRLVSGARTLVDIRNGLAKWRQFVTWSDGSCNDGRLRDVFGSWPAPRRERGTRRIIMILSPSILWISNGGRWAFSKLTGGGFNSTADAHVVSGTADLILSFGGLPCTSVVDLDLAIAADWLADNVLDFFVFAEAEAVGTDVDVFDVQRPIAVAALVSLRGGGLFSCLAGLGGSSNFFSTLRNTTPIIGASLFFTVTVLLGGVTRRKLTPCRTSCADCDLSMGIGLDATGSDVGCVIRFV